MDKALSMADKKQDMIQMGRRARRRRFMRNRQLMVGGGLVVALIFLGVFAPWIAPYPYDEAHYDRAWERGSREFPLGTDELGRDLLSRIIYGTRISLAVAFGSAFIVLVVGTFVGAVSGYFAGRVDFALMRMVDIVLAFPSLLFIILLSVVLGSGIVSMILAIGLTRWANLTRVVRGEFLRFRSTEFVLAAHAVGVPRTRVILRHILPNTVAPIIVFITFAIPFAIVAEAGLGFIGLGVNPPLPSWGVLLNNGFRSFRSFPNLVLYPSLMLALTMFAFILFGDGLRAGSDPTMESP
jgi:ABC-type dipeptide/oligopeptide/nickel transport system permease subunit